MDDIVGWKLDFVDYNCDFVHLFFVGKVQVWPVLSPFGNSGKQAIASASFLLCRRVSSRKWGIRKWMGCRREIQTHTRITQLEKEKLAFGWMPKIWESDSIHIWLIMEKNQFFLMIIWGKNGIEPSAGMISKHIEIGIDSYSILYGK